MAERNRKKTRLPRGKAKTETKKGVATRVGRESSTMCFSLSMCCRALVATLCRAVVPCRFARQLEEAEEALSREE